MNMLITGADEMKGLRWSQYVSVLFDEQGMTTTYSCTSSPPPSAEAAYMISMARLLTSNSNIFQLFPMQAKDSQSKPQFSSSQVKKTWKKHAPRWKKTESVETTSEDGVTKLEAAELHFCTFGVPASVPRDSIVHLANSCKFNRIIPVPDTRSQGLPTVRAE